MKVAVTGHTVGIGKELVKFFKGKDFEVLGFSRSNGYDIKDFDAREKIINESAKCDIFVNNAYSFNDNSQLLLLQRITETWIGQEKLIINISSRAGDFAGVAGHPWPEYAKMKSQTDIFCHTRNGLPWMLNLKPGNVDTQLTKDRNEVKMDVEVFSKILDFIFDNRSNFIVRSITFAPCILTGSLKID